MTTINQPGDLNILWSQRSMYYAGAHQEMDRLVSVYRGEIPEEFLDFFHEEMHVHVLNMIRLAWDDLATLAGKEFALYVPSDNEKSTAKQRAEKLERIGHGYNRAGRPAGGVTMKSLMKVLMWWLVGTANCVLMTLPDYEHKSPFFTFRDPRTHYPPVGWSPWNETKAEDALFAYRKSVSQLKAEYPDAKDEISQSLRSTYALGIGGGRVPNDDERFVWAGEYYHKDSWMTAILEDKAVILARSDTGDRGHPGIQPVTAMSLYDATDTKGRSIFADQISVQAAMARMFSQKLDYYDRTLYPLIFTTPLAGKTIKVGPYAINEFDITMGVPPRLDVVGPTSSIEDDQVMAFAVGMSRILNRNPEQMQGAGAADSAKALNELMKGVQQTIRDYIWPNAIEVLPSAYSNAAKMDRSLWGDVRKDAAGRYKGESFRIPYRPNVDLKGRENDFEVKPGVGLAGYQGTLEIMQLVQAELMAEDEALEEGDWSTNAQESKRRIQAMRMEKLIWANLQARAAQPAGTPGALLPGAMGRLRDMTQKEGKDLFDAVKDLEESGQLFSEAPAPMGPEALGGAPGAGGLAGLFPPPDLAAVRR